MARARVPTLACLALTTPLLLAACGTKSGADRAPTPSCPSATSAPATSIAPSIARATTSAAPSTSSASAAASAASEPPALPKALALTLDAAMTAITKGDWKAADDALAKADELAGKEAHCAYVVARVRADRFAEVGDFERAGATLTAVIPLLAKHPELSDEFGAHNAMMMIREAQGDPASALAENDQATLCAARGTWAPDERETLAFQKDRWHRAYLSRMLAESRTGSAREALIAYAKAALDEYKTRGFDDSVAVLEAYFAALDGKKEAALAAAKKVDPEKDEDLEDLYLVVIGLEAGGDHAAADRVRKVMRAPAEPRLSRAIMLRWLDADAKGASGGFTPWHAAGK
jgi:tetratricopeptide (TPR) repeat protein